MATYIDFSSEEEQSQSLAKYLSKIKNKGKEDEAFLETIAKLVEQNQNVDILAKLIEDSPALFAESAPEKEIESFFMVVCSQLKKLGVEAVHQLTPKLLNVVTSSTEDKVVVRLRILNNMYNILDVSPSDRYEIFAAAMKFSKKTKNAELFIPHFKDLEKRIKEWGIDAKQTRELLQSIRDIYRDCNKTAQAFEWTVKLLSTYENPSEIENESVAKDVISAVIDTIKSPDVFVFDQLLEIPIVKKLEEKQNSVYQLLRVFVTENIDGWTSFAQSNEAFLKSFDIEPSKCESKMRLLTLATLASANDEIPYALIAKTLKIDESEVETWVINAISEGVIEAKMDQLKRIVVVSRCIQRVFTKAQWQQLSESLSKWKTNVQLLLDVIHKNKSQPFDPSAAIEGLKP